ncbi:type II toxin-antitoxin system VapC family toxin [Verrucomicrobiaceae bacterium R5-34]|nr:type II toxin-antitoxin system VapC family toxin [Verrucomicrobiaceae bacterium R5-34]
MDTNVISDVIHSDPKWEPWALDQLSNYFRELMINPIIFAELCCRATSTLELEETLAPFEFIYHELPKEALFQASQAFIAYRKRGGTKSSPLPGFFIGAHALVLEIPILTRDVSRYRTYFPEVRLITP